MKISIEVPQERFDYHLALPNNNRILFSGKFGTGKSHFLKEYFEHNKEKYNLFWLSPVDYVVGANQDIFEWIKIDIAKELLEKYLIKEDKTPFSKNLLIQTYIHNNIGALITQLLAFIATEYGKRKTGSDIANDLLEQLKEYQKFEEGIKKELKSSFTKLADHITNSTSIKGSIYEDDLITQVIRASVELTKTKTRKPSVLVIDDLDRLDPEHIFRILNVLSSHNNHFDSNKFGFDSAIVVCDIENIKHTYQHRYGEKCDFDGYIEKFYSYEPFVFSIYDAIVTYCESEAIALELDSNNVTVLKLFLKSFFELRLLKVRNLKKIYNLNLTRRLPKRNYKTTASKYFEQDSHIHNCFIETPTITVDYDKYGFFKVLYILSAAFGGKDSLVNAIAQLAKTNGAIPQQYQSAVINTIAIPFHIATNIYFSDSRAFYTLSAYTEMGPPTINFISLNAQIPLRWDAKDKYNGGHFFEFWKEDLLFREFDRGRKNVSETMTWNNVAPEVLKILRFLEHERFFENI